MKKPEFLNFQPVYDPTPYKDIPKVRGILASLVISLMVWFVTSTILCVVLAGIYLLLCSRPLAPLGWSIIFGFAAFVEFLARGTMYICFIGCRTWPSLAKVIMFSIFGRRVGGGSNSGVNRINRINTLGY